MDLEMLEISELRQRRGEKWRRYPDDVLPAFVADMDFGLAPPLRRYLESGVARSDVGYPLHPEEHGVPRAFCERMQRLHGWAVEPHQVEVLSDVVQGLYLGLETFSSVGQAVVSPVPVYPPFLGALRALERTLVPLPYVASERRYELDFERLEAELLPNTRVLMLCHPHNPTGRVHERRELERLAELALRHDWIVLSDEIHADLCLSGSRHVPFASLGPEVEARTLTLTSASKAFNIAGLRCALAVFGSSDLRKRFQACQRHARGGIGILGLEATRIAWQECDAWLESLRSQLAANRDVVAEYVARRWPGVVHLRPEATYLAWLDCGRLELAEGAYRFFLRHAKVALSPGAAFGAAGDAFVRLNFATSPRILHEILERMDSALEQHAHA